MSIAERRNMVAPLLLDAMRDVTGSIPSLSEATLSDQQRTQAVAEVTRACEAQPEAALLPTVLRNSIQRQVDDIFNNVEHEVGSP
jgi:hypothetical protein